MSSGYGDNSKHKATSDAYRNNKIWDKKDMASSTSEPMPQTIEAYKALAQRDLELIEEQQREIGQLKAKINKLEQRRPKGERTQRTRSNERRTKTITGNVYSFRLRG